MDLFCLLTTKYNVLAAHHSHFVQAAIQIPEIKLLKNKKLKLNYNHKVKLFNFFPRVSAQGCGRSSIYLRVYMSPEKETIT